MQNFTWLNNFVRQNFRKAEFNRARKGFTLIELIVVIAIIGILAGIVVTSVNGYINKAKLARANVEAENIGKALTQFYTEYGDYPHSGDGNCGGIDPWCQSVIAPLVAWAGASGEPYLTVGEEHKYLSEFLKFEWSDYNAKYIAPTAFFQVLMGDTSGDSKIDCVFLYISAYPAGVYHVYGAKKLIDTEGTCEGDELDFQIDPY